MRLLRMLGDDKLVGEVRAGSEAAFEVVYDRHHRGILAFCRHMLGSREEAEDAVQHTFMAAYRDLVGSDKPIQLKAWLYTIARNRCLTVLRARRERPLDEIDEPSTEGLAAEVQRRQDLRDLLRDVATLPDDQRAALVLAEVGDVSHDQIASILGCQKQKVKALVFQARSSLTASRDARETPCVEIREQLANLRGGSLRRNSLRRHLRECAGCRAFRTDMDAQRRALAVVLPVAPAVGLKEAVLTAAIGGGGGGGAVVAGGAAAGGGAVAAGGAAAGGGALAAKALVVLAIAGAGAGGVAGVSAIGSDDKPTDVERAAPDRPAGSAGGGGKGPGGGGTNAAGLTPAAGAGTAGTEAAGDDAEARKEDDDKDRDTRRKQGTGEVGGAGEKTRGKGRDGRTRDGSRGEKTEDETARGDAAPGNSPARAPGAGKKPKAVSAPKPKKAKKNERGEHVPGNGVGNGYGHRKDESGAAQPPAKPEKSPKPAKPAPPAKPPKEKAAPPPPPPAATPQATPAPANDDDADDGGGEDGDDGGNGGKKAKDSSVGATVSKVVGAVEAPVGRTVKGATGAPGLNEPK